MSGTPKSQRSPTKFEAEHNLYALRDSITELIILDFSYSTEKYKEKIEKYRESHKTAANVDEVVARYMRKRDSFDRFFVDEMSRTVLDITRRISMEFTAANSIYPSQTSASKISEYCQRRKHLNEAIAQCFVLKQEINYAIRTLPVDINKYKRFDDAINKQIALFKGIRKADNRFLKDKPNKNKN